MKNLKFVQIIHKNVPNLIQADKKRMKQILMNLISNANKFTQKGEIKVEMEIDEPELNETQMKEQNTYLMQLKQ